MVAVSGCTPVTTSLLPLNLAWFGGRLLALLFPGIPQLFLKHFGVMDTIADLLFAFVHGNDRVRLCRRATLIVITPLSELRYPLGAIHQKFIGHDLLDAPGIVCKVMIHLDHPSPIEWMSLV